MEKNIMEKNSFLDNPVYVKLINKDYPWMRQGSLDLSRVANFFAGTVHREFIGELTVAERYDLCVRIAEKEGEDSRLANLLFYGHTYDLDWLKWMVGEED